MKPLFKIVNMVSLWKVDRTFIIKSKECKTGKKFNAEVLKYKEGKYLIFASGSITAVGFLSTAHAREGLEYFFPLQTIDCLRVINSVASGQIFIRNFDELTKFKEIIWEPEIFPAAYWYYQKKWLIFNTPLSRSSPNFFCR